MVKISIPTKIFKLIATFVSAPLCTIVNSSIDNATFPDILKVATVIPVFKLGSSTDVNNYRPISILPLLSKIFEKCICNRLSSFFIET